MPAAATRPLAMLAVVTGLWLWFGYGFSGGWLHAKLALVALLVAYHHACGIYRVQLAERRCRRSSRFFRLFNELPVLVLVWLASRVQATRSEHRPPGPAQP